MLTSLFLVVNQHTIMIKVAHILLLIIATVVASFLPSEDIYDLVYNRDANGHLSIKPKYIPLLQSTHPVQIETAKRLSSRNVGEMGCCPNLNFTKVFTFAFENRSANNPTLIDTGLTCWTQKLGMNSSQFNQFLADALNWFKVQYGFDVSVGLFVPGIGWFVPGFGALIPSRFDANYRMISADPPGEKQTPGQLLTACNLILVPLPFFIPAFTEYGGNYRNYLNNRGFTAPRYIYVELDDNLVYGAYALECLNGTIKQILNKSYVPIFNNDDFNTRSERALLVDVTGDWGSGILYGTSNVYTTQVDGKYIYSARATWTFPGNNPFNYI